MTTAVRIGRGVTVREMAPADVAAAARLSRDSGWNQTEADWRFILGENPRRFVVAVRDGAVVGTGGAACYYARRLAWVCMILVDAAERGHGLGAAIVTAVLDRVADMEVVGLDATPSGRPVYERLGFAATSALVRMGGRPVVAPDRSGVSETRGLDARDLETIFALDREAFGADRARSIRWAATTAPTLAWCAIDGGVIAGYCLGRHGEKAAHVGPVIARDTAVARALVARAAASVPGRDLMIDVPADQPEWMTALRAMGLREQRPFTRMYRAGATPPGRPGRTFAVFGPELG